MIIRHKGHGWFLWAPTMTEMVHRTVADMAEVVDPDVVLNIETHLFDVTLTADNCNYDLDVGKELHLNVSRWSRLIREYLPRDPWERFRDQAHEILHGSARKGATANMMFRDPDRYAKKHRWGGCLMGATFRMGPDGFAGTLTFYSRTTYIGYMGLLDAAIAHVMAREIGNPGTIRFQWHISSMQLHTFKTLPYIYRRPDLNRKLEKYVRNPRLAESAPPWWRYAARWQQYFVKKFDEGGIQACEEEKYGPSRRVFRRWLETRGILTKNIPPSLLTNKLTLEKAQ